ncbi:MAG TPA: hypothetical protein PKD99_06915 [Sphingopyxis sp.]|nr:hypothetical protein [Sphingopyxis sp.]HMP44822.1 hypothetical protein [Sphingopyxis sp.]HMQ19629.1 hypothetical protein [Sphingopyxis sp.]
MSESHPSLAGLRRRLARIAGDAEPRAEGAGRIASGHAGFDAALGGGLARGRMHEFFAADALDAASAAAFAALLALCGEGDAPILWLRMDDGARRAGQVYGPGFAELGGDPGRLLIVEAGDASALLRAANDAARAPGSAAVVVESWGAMPALDLTAGRRLVLAARGAGTTLLMLRLAASPVPSVAETRWDVRAAPSAALAAEAAGGPAFDLELLRWRAGPAGMRWRLEWNRDERSFRDAALSGAVLPLPARRAPAARRAAAA